MLLIDASRDLLFDCLQYAGKDDFRRHFEDHLTAKSDFKVGLSRATFQLRNRGVMAKPQKHRQLLLGQPRAAAVGSEVTREFLSHMIYNLRDRRGRAGQQDPS